MQQIFGDFVQNKSCQEYLEVHFSPTLTPLRQRWRNNSLSANFLSEYWATFFPAQDIDSLRLQQEVRGCINYVANELLENVMKFSYQPIQNPVTLGIYLYHDAFRFYTRNAISPKAVPEFQARIKRMLKEDTRALEMQQIKKNVVEEEKGTSQLGLLTLINDYGARLAWMFERSADNSGPEIITVNTMAELSIKEACTLPSCDPIGDNPPGEDIE